MSQGQIQNKTPTAAENHELWMKMALSLARSAEKIGEVPVGAVVVRENELVATGINLRESSKDACAHAELVAIRRACEILGRWRLSDCTLYVSLEPCLMCAGAILSARLKALHYAAKDPKAGAMGSLYDCHCDARLNHELPITVGQFADESSMLLKNFFKIRRRSNRNL